MEVKYVQSSVNNNDNNNNKVNTDSDLLVCANCSCPSVETGDQRGTKKQLKHFLWLIHPYAGHPPKGFLYFVSIFVFIFVAVFIICCNDTQNGYYNIQCTQDNMTGQQINS